MALFGPPNIEKLAAKKNVKGLIKALDYNRGDLAENHAVRLAAVKALGKLRDPRAAAALVEKLHRFYDISQRGEYAYQGYLFDPETFVVSEILVGFGQPAVEPLMAALELEDQSRESRYRFSRKAFLIAVTLSKIGVQLGDPGMCATAFEVFLREKFIAQYETHSIMHALNDKLSELANPAMELLVEALLSQDPRSKSILELLELVKDPRSVEPLILILQNSGEDVLRLKAVNVLRLMKDSRALEPLTAVLMDPFLGSAAAKALGVMQDPRAVAPLKNALKHEDKHVRAAAVHALWKLKVQEAGLFMPALKDTEACVRTAAIKALADLGDTRAVEPLLANLAAWGWEERKLTAEALLKFYQREDLNAQIRKKILAKRKLIVEPHQSQVNCDTFHHYDTGIGLDFPL